MSARRWSPERVVLKIDRGPFVIGLVIGYFAGKLVFRSTRLAVAFALGVALAVGTSESAGQQG